jgi:hypothetical protein
MLRLSTVSLLLLLLLCLVLLPELEELLGDSHKVVEGEAHCA